MAKNSSLYVNLGQGLSVRIGLPKVVSWNSSTRPKKPQRGTFGFNSQTSSIEYWDGSSWWAAEMDES